jgi:hypothetical protein
MGMMFRNPQRIAATRRFVEDIALNNYEASEAEYNAQKKDGDPDYLDALVRDVSWNTIDWTATIMDSPNVGVHLNQMRWSVRDITGAGLTLMTSDRPVLMTNGLAATKRI